MNKKRRYQDECYKEIRRVLSVGGNTGLECHHVRGRKGLLYINPHFITPLTREQHIQAHKNTKKWRKENGYDEVWYEKAHKTTTEDYKTLRNAFKRCRTHRDLMLVYDAWLEDLA